MQCEFVGVATIELGPPITISIVTGNPHCPTDGVNVYVVVPATVVLIDAGLQVPVTPSREDAGNNGATEFWHNGPIWVKVGVICVAMVIFIVNPRPHWPAFGVNVYIVVPTAEVLMVAGFHVPIIPLVEVNGNAGAIEFRQNGPIASNVGVIWSVTVMLKVVEDPHWPASGVNVYIVVPAVTVLIVGLQLPVIPLLETFGNWGGVEFRHSGPTASNVGVIW
jgi:hypothetical protein